jgi:hypothetical protein
MAAKNIVFDSYSIDRNVHAALSDTVPDDKNAIVMGTTTNDTALLCGGRY